MATVLTQFQQRRAQRRKTSDIENLFKQYQQQMADIAGQSEASYGAYKKQVAATMAPYEAATGKYKTDFSKYETDLASYRNSIASYQNRIAYAMDNPTTEVPTSDYAIQQRRGGTLVSIGGKSYNTSANANELPEGYTFEGGKLYKVTDPGTFEGAAPSAPPSVPEMPSVAGFDTSQFEEKRKIAEETFKREVGERKSGKLGAVSKRGARSLLSGATA